MNILFSTQDSSVRMFYELSKKLKNNNIIHKSAFTVTNKQFYDSWIKKNNEFIESNEFIKKEWELYSTSKKEKLDVDLLKKYEDRLGINPGLFSGIVADRRLFMGNKNSFIQDYRRRFSDQNLLKILQFFLKEIDSLFYEFKPDIVVSFQCVTLIDYLMALFSREKKIKYLNLRPTKIDNRVIFSSTVNDPPPEISKLFSEIMKKNGEGFNFEEVNDYILHYREQIKHYEGVVMPALTPTDKIHFNMFRLGKFKNILINIYNYYFYKYYRDNQVSNPLIRLLYVGVLNPYRAKKINRFLRKIYIQQNQLSKLKYIFFPMHTEPEVSLLVHGKPFINQIELIRMIAISMPIDTILLVKEHPWMIGKRSLNYYKKLLNIPRVSIVRPDIVSREIILKASLLTVITSSISLEGILLKKPCITFGDCMTNLLPNSMCQMCVDLKSLPTTINSLINSKIKIDWDLNLKAMLYSIYQNSRGVNLYTTLLGRKGRFSESNKTFDEEILSLYKSITYSLENRSVNFNDSDNKNDNKSFSIW